MIRKIVFLHRYIDFYFSIFRMPQWIYPLIFMYGRNSVQLSILTIVILILILLFSECPQWIYPLIFQVWSQLSSTECQHHSIIVRIFAYMQYSQSYVCYAYPDIVPQIIGYKKSIKQTFKSGLFWAVGAEEKKSKLP